MFTSVEGVYQDGVIKLAEQPAQVPAGSPVIVTFLQDGGADLRAYGIDAAAAAHPAKATRRMRTDALPTPPASAP